jgi:uncharacterized protein YndB with AHSA1/START domain
MTMSQSSETDRIERSVVINASRERVWRALSNAEEFGTWFGVNLAGQTFSPGRPARGPVTHKGYEHIIWEVTVERLEPPDLLSFRWHPYAIDPNADYSQEEPTLVTFTLKGAPGNATLLTVVESGFDKVPPHRRLDAFRMNSSGWTEQMKNIVRHVAA